jgi:hypothetical protein
MLLSQQTGGMIMTYQQDPEGRRTDETRLGYGPSRYMRRDDGGWGTLPVVLALVFVVLVGYMLMNRGDHRATNTGVSDIHTTNDPASTKNPTNR